MNPNAPSRRTVAFTLVEMLTVIAIIGILAALLLPVLDKSEGRAKRIVCVNTLEQVGLAFHTFSNDHNGKFPMAISTNDGGSMEYVQSGFESGGQFYTAFRHFQALSSELGFPQTLVCPTDTRVVATNFPSLQNENLSYFAGVQSTFDKPTTVLAGDRNLVTNSFDQPTILGLGPVSDLGWTWELHRFKGNVLIADGHVEQWNSASLASAESASPFSQSLFLPSVVPGAQLQYANGPSGPAPGNPGSPGPSPSGSGPPDSGSGPAPSYPGSPSSEPMQAPSSTVPDANSVPSQAPTPPAGQSMPSHPDSSKGQLSITDAFSQAQPDQNFAAAGIPTNPPSGTDEVVSVQDQNGGMSEFDRHMTLVMQNSLEWLYLLLCILVLLYLLNRIRKRARKR